MSDRRLARWFDLVGASAPMRAFVLGELSAPARHWHGLIHHALMLRTLAAGGHAPTVLRRLVLATLFHDIVYDARATDNEEASAAVATEWVASEERDAVAALILATKRHDLRTDPVTRALLDADLGVLLTPSERLYAFYARGIRAEYAHVDDAGYRAGRAAVMARLREELVPHLDGGRRTSLIRNVDAELAALAGGEYDLG